MKKLLNLFLWNGLILFSILISSCEKKPGKGGDASITGRIWVKHYNTTFTQFISEYPGADIYVYIIYGDDISYGSRIKSNYDGYFEFKYLYPGDYKVYTYSLDSTLAAPSGNVPIVKEVTINDRTQTVDLGTIEIFQ